MSENKDSMIICKRTKTVTIDIILPEEKVSEIEDKMVEELGVDAEKFFISILHTREGLDFGDYGRRWHTSVDLPLSEEEDFCGRLRKFCEKYNIPLDEEGKDPFEGHKGLTSEDFK